MFLQIPDSQHPFEKLQLVVSETVIKRLDLTLKIPNRVIQHFQTIFIVLNSPADLRDDGRLSARFRLHLLVPCRPYVL